MDLDVRAFNFDFPLAAGEHKEGDWEQIEGRRPSSVRTGKQKGRQADGTAAFSTRYLIITILIIVITIPITIMIIDDNNNNSNNNNKFAFQLMMSWMCAVSTLYLQLTCQHSLICHWKQFSRSSVSWCVILDLKPISDR